MNNHEGSTWVNLLLNAITKRFRQDFVCLDFVGSFKSFQVSDLNLAKSAKCLPFVAARLRSLRTNDPLNKGHPRSIEKEIELCQTYFRNYQTNHFIY